MPISISFVGSDWETDISERSEPQVADKDPSESEHEPDASTEVTNVEVVVESQPTTTSLSYSSILKQSKQSTVTAASSEQKSAATSRSKVTKIDNVVAAKIAAVTKVKNEEEKKKVTTKTPIEFDLLSALTTVRKNKDKKAAARAAGIKRSEPERPTVRAVRNALDSSAPLRKRGKEREGGRKKRKTVLKKTILAERARKKEQREAAEKREGHFNVFAVDCFLPPLPPTHPTPAGGSPFVVWLPDIQANSRLSHK